MILFFNDCVDRPVEILVVGLHFIAKKIRDINTMLKNTKGSAGAYKSKIVMLTDVYKCIIFMSARRAQK